MVWFGVILLMLVGLFLLVAPPSWLMYGSRWMYRNGQSVEPSRAYMIYTRVVGAVLIVFPIGIWLVVSTLIANIESDADRRVEQEQIWGVDLWGDDELAVVPFENVEKVADLDAAIAGLGEHQGVLPITHEVVPGGESGALIAAPGEHEVLVLVPSIACTPTTVLIEVDEEGPRIAVIGDRLAVGIGATAGYAACDLEAGISSDSERMTVLRVTLPSDADATRTEFVSG